MGKIKKNIQALSIHFMASEKKKLIVNLKDDACV
jgi:hypothetical protein